MGEEKSKEEMQKRGKLKRDIKVAEDYKRAGRGQEKIRQRR